MRPNNWIALGLMTAVFSISAFAEHGSRGGDNDESRLKSSVIGSTPGQIIGGILSGGAPWTVREADASLSDDGKLKVEVEGLLIAAGTGIPPALVGTVGPVKMVAASLVCAGSGGAVAASTGPVPFDSMGNAEIKASVMLPASCIAPVVLVRVANAGLGPFIAATGFNSSKSDD